MPRIKALGNNPSVNHFGKITPQLAKIPLTVPSTLADQKRYFQTVASVHCGMMYGKIKIVDIYFLHGISLLVTSQAVTPPNRRANAQARTPRSSDRPSGT